MHFGVGRLWRVTGGLTDHPVWCLSFASACSRQTLYRDHDPREAIGVGRVVGRAKFQGHLGRCSARMAP